MLNPKAPAPNLLDNDDLPSPLSSNPYGLSNAAPPPLPPNPALLALRAQVHLRLSTSLHQLHGSTTQSLAQLALLGDDLGKGPSAIEDEMKRLEIVRDVCQVVRARYEEVVRTGQERREVYRRKLGSDGLGPEVDEIVCSVSVVHNQYVYFLVWSGGRLTREQIVGSSGGGFSARRHNLSSWTSVAVRIDRT